MLRLFLPVLRALGVGLPTLNGAGQSFDSYFSYSWAQGLFFVNDGASLSWRGYDVF